MQKSISILLTISLLLVACFANSSNSRTCTQNCRTDADCLNAENFATDNCFDVVGENFLEFQLSGRNEVCNDFFLTVQNSNSSAESISEGYGKCLKEYAQTLEGPNQQQYGQCFGQCAIDYTYPVDTQVYSTEISSFETCEFVCQINFECYDFTDCHAETVRDLPNNSSTNCQAYAEDINDQNLSEDEKMSSLLGCLEEAVVNFEQNSNEYNFMGCMHTCVQENQSQIEDNTDKNQESESMSIILQAFLISNILILFLAF